MASFAEVLDIYEIIVNGVAILLNFYLLLLIRLKTRREIGRYRYLVATFALNDMFFAALHILLMPKTLLTSNACGLVATGVLGFIPYSVDLYAAFYTLAQTLIDYHFLYRKWAIERPALTSLFARPLFIALLILIACVEMGIWFTFCSLTFIPAPRSNDALNTYLYSRYGINGTNLSWIVTDFYLTDGSLSYLHFAGLCCAMAIQFADFSFMVYCGTSIVRNMRSSIQMSAKSRDLHKQLLQMLFVQTLVPVVLMYTPCALLITSPLFGVTAIPAVDYAIPLICLFPAIDALVVICMMKDYREATVTFCYWLTRIDRDNVSETTLPITTKKTSGKFIMPRKAVEPASQKDVPQLDATQFAN